MNIQWIPCIELSLLVLSLCIAWADGILCSQCNSKKDGAAGASAGCEARAPPAMPCSSSTAATCTIIRELDSQGVQLAFIRDCSPAEKQEDGETCRTVLEHPAPGQTAKICYTECDYNNCNGGTSGPRATATAGLLSVLAARLVLATWL